MMSSDGSVDHEDDGEAEKAETTKPGATATVMAALEADTGKEPVSRGVDSSGYGENDHNHIEDDDNQKDEDGSNVSERREEEEESKRRKKQEFPWIGGAATYVEKLKRVLRDTARDLAERPEGEGGSESTRRRRRRRRIIVGVVAAVAVASIIGYRNRAEGKRRNRKEGEIASILPSLLSSWSSSSYSPVTALFSTLRVLLLRNPASLLVAIKKAVSSLFEQPEYYTAAVESPLSFLYQSAREGRVEKALLGPSAVYYLIDAGPQSSTSPPPPSSARWHKATLPVDNPHLKTDLVKTISSAAANGRPRDGREGDGNGKDGRSRTTEVSALPEPLSSRLATPIFAALPFVYLAFVYKILKEFHSRNDGNDLSSGRVNSRQVHDAARTTTFRDVAGIDRVVREVGDVVSYMRDPSRFRAVGARPPGGILLYGPPGTGKTLLARAMAGESDVDCFTACSASDFVEVFVGRGAARVRSIFRETKRQARDRYADRQRIAMREMGRGGGAWDRILGMLPSSSSNATTTTTSSAWSTTTITANGGVGKRNRGEILLRKQPVAILFIDELDALAKTRSSWNSNDEREQTLNQLLTEMDGFGSPSAAPSLSAAALQPLSSTRATESSGDHDRTAGARADGGENTSDGSVVLIVIAASNRADILDPAVLRRFDRQIHVGHPDRDGRRAILRVHARGVRCDEAGIRWDDLSSDRLTGHFSGADLRNVVNEAGLLAIRDGSDVVRHGHLERAARRIRQMKSSLMSEGASSLLLPNGHILGGGVGRRQEERK